MHWIQNLKNKLTGLSLLAIVSSGTFAQVNLELSYNPGFTTVTPAFNVNPIFTNTQLLFLAGAPDDSKHFLIGAQFMNRGSGARVGIFQNGSFARYERVSENFYFIHIPIGLRFKHQAFYIDGAIAIDQYLFYRKKQAGHLISTEPQNSSQLQKTLFGLHLEGGTLYDISEDIAFKAGIQISNTFSGNLTQGYLNFQVSIGFIFRMSGDREESEEEDDMYFDDY